MLRNISRLPLLRTKSLVSSSVVASSGLCQRRTATTSSVEPPTMSCANTIWHLHSDQHSGRQFWVCQGSGAKVYDRPTTGQIVDALPTTGSCRANISTDSDVGKPGSVWGSDSVYTVILGSLVVGLFTFRFWFPLSVYLFGSTKPFPPPVEKKVDQ